MNMLLEWLEPKIQQRVGEIGMMVSNAVSYQNSAEQYNNLFNEVMTALPEEKRDLLFELDFLVGKMVSELSEQMYKAGLKDGITLAKDISHGLFGESTSEKWMFSVQTAS